MFSCKTFVIFPSAGKIKYTQTQVVIIAGANETMTRKQKQPFLQKRRNPTVLKSYKNPSVALGKNSHVGSSFFLKRITPCLR